MFHVLVPVDSNEKHARRAASTVLKLPDFVDEVKITLLNVERKINVSGAERVRSEEWYDESDFPESVGIAKDLLEGGGFDVSLRREHEEPGEAILNVADDTDADWIIMAGRKRSPVGKVLFGSVAQSVLLHAELPVTMAME